MSVVFLVQTLTYQVVYDLMKYASVSEPETALVLKRTLSLLWEEFRIEYERVPLESLDDKYSGFISIIEHRGSTL